MNASGSSSSGSMIDDWPTPQNRDFKGVDRTSLREHNARPLNEVAAHWPTPRTITGGAESAERKQELGRQESGGGDLQAAAATWATPRASDGEKGGPNQSFGAGGVPLVAQASRWSTPSVADSTGGRTSRSGDRKDELLLNSQAKAVSSWPTPTSLSFAESHQPGNSASYNATMELASSLRGPPKETAGETCSSERRTLNPLFVEWLMGWPTGWTASACSATELSRFKQHMRSALSQLTSHAAPPAQLSLFG